MMSLVKTLIDKMSIEVFFMTLFLFSLSLLGLILFLNKISFIFLVMYCGLSISLSYFLSRVIVFYFSKEKMKRNAKVVEVAFKTLSTQDKEILLEIISKGDIGITVKSKSINRLYLLNFLLATDANMYGFKYKINSEYRNEICRLLLLDFPNK